MSVTKLSQILNEVGAEYISATCEFGRFNSAHEGYAVIEEEYEELKKEVFKKGWFRNRSKMRKECIQLAAMAIRFIADVCDKDGDNDQTRTPIANLE